MLLVIAALSLTALTAATLSAAFYGVVTRFEADDLPASLDRREWRQPATGEYRGASLMVYTER